MDAGQKNEENVSFMSRVSSLESRRSGKLYCCFGSAFEAVIFIFVQSLKKNHHFVLGVLFFFLTSFGHGTLATWLLLPSCLLALWSEVNVQFSFSWQIQTALKQCWTNTLGTLSPPPPHPGGTPHLETESIPGTSWSVHFQLGPERALIRQQNFDEKTFVSEPHHLWDCFFFI